MTAENTQHVETNEENGGIALTPRPAQPNKQLHACTRSTAQREGIDAQQSTHDTHPHTCTPTNGCDINLQQVPTGSDVSCVKGRLAQRGKPKYS
jgi:hypothetical protein